MKKLTLAVLAGAAVSIAACGGNKGNNTSANGSASENSSAAAGEKAAGDNGSAGGAGAATASASAWPKGTRLVEEGGVTYRIDPNGTRVRLEAADGRIVVDNGVRYHVDGAGVRVRLDDRGVRIGDSVIRGNAPNGGSDVETPGEAASDALEDAVEAVGDIDNPPRRDR